MTEQQTLSLKHFTSYENLEVIVQGHGIKEKDFVCGILTLPDEIVVLGDNEDYYIGQENEIEIKLLLRPLSKVKDGMIAYYGYPNREMFEEDVRNKTVSVLIWNELLDNHYDLFGLLEKGSAIEKTSKE